MGKIKDFYNKHKTKIKTAGIILGTATVGGLLIAIGGKKYDSTVSEDHVIITPDGNLPSDDEYKIFDDLDEAFKVGQYMVDNKYDFALFYERPNYKPTIVDLYGKNIPKVKED